MKNRPFLSASILAALLLAACGRGGPPADGAALYAANCQVCHGDAATGRGAMPDTPLHSNAGHTWHHPDAQLMDIILGRLNVPGRKMPKFAGTLTEAEVEAVLAYIKSGWGEQEREFQAEVNANWESIKR